MKYIKKFNTKDEYTIYEATIDVTIPSLSGVVSTKKLYYYCPNSFTLVNTITDNPKYQEMSLRMSPVGMTWKQWINSKYNILNCYDNNGYVSFKDTITDAIIYVGSNVDYSFYMPVSVNEIISPLMQYQAVILSTFTVQNNSYTGTGSFTTKTFSFTNGMTWTDFINSPFNTDGFMVPGGGYYANIVRFKTYDYLLGTTKNGNDVTPTDVIIADYTYHIDGWSCFVAGTQVLTSLDGDTKNIEDIKVGDDVISYDIENKKNYEAIVADTYTNDNSYHIAKVICADGTILEMAPSHPLYTKEGWKSITRYHDYPELKIGDIVKTIDDWSEIVTIEYSILDTPITTYTFNVKDKNEELDIDTNDNYYANGVLAHNKSSK